MRCTTKVIEPNVKGFNAAAETHDSILNGTVAASTC